MAKNEKDKCDVDFSYVKSYKKSKRNKEEWENKENEVKYLVNKRRLLYEKLHLWEESDKLISIQATKKYDMWGYNELPTEFVDFEKLKNEAIKQIRTKLDNLKRELNNL